MSTTTPVLDDLSVHMIDRQVMSLSIELDRTTDPATAGDLALRVQALRSMRPIAAAREQADQRRQQVVRSRADRQAFDALEADVTADLGAQAARLDAWVREGAGLMQQYRDIVHRFEDVEAVLDPAPPGRGADLAMALARMALDERLLNCLAAAGVVSHIVVPAISRGESWSIEAHVAGQVRRFFGLAKQRLPPPVPDEPVRDEATADAGTM